MALSTVSDTQYVCNDYVLMILGASSRIARRSRPSLARSGKETDIQSEQTALLDQTLCPTPQII
jgi:hypothetical protein